METPTRAGTRSRDRRSDLDWDMECEGITTSASGKPLGWLARNKQLPGIGNRDKCAQTDQRKSRSRALSATQGRG